MVKTLGEFIRQYMADEHLSAHDMAEKMGCSHTTISKFSKHGIEETYSGRPVGDPDFGFIRSLARLTQTDVLAVCALVIGHEKIKEVSPEDLLLAQTINTLGDETKQNIYAIIRAMRQRQSNASNDDRPVGGT